MIIFSSGSCRVGFPLTYLHCQKLIELIDPHWDADHPHHQIGNVEPLALGHLHNITEHYRMFQLLKDDSDDAELVKALYMISKPGKRHLKNWRPVWDHCKSLWKKCEFVVVEISSLKANRRDLTPVTIEQTIAGIKDIEEMLSDKKILWVNHIRPKIVYGDSRDTKWGEQRENIHEVIFTHGTHVFDPSPYVTSELLRDDSHYNSEGIKMIGKKMFEKFEQLR